MLCACRLRRGGVQLLAQCVIAAGGYVCGAAFDENWSVKHIIVDNLEDLKRLYKSKYVQSSTQNIFRDVECLLKQGKTVLFTGTPCQVAGLYGYLGKDYINLVTVDILCHGVPGDKLWQKYLEENYDKRKIKNIDFRNKDKLGWACSSLSVLMDNDETIIDDTYMTPFHRNLSTRYSCDSCAFKRYERVSDITFGDFWGISSIDNTLNDNKGLSFMVLNTPKGQKFFKYIKKNAIIVKKFDNKNIQNSLYTGRAHKHKNYFLSDIIKGEKSFSDCAQRWLKNTYDTAVVGYYSGWNYGSSMTYYGLYKTIKDLGYSCFMVQNPENAANNWKPLPIKIFRENPYDLNDLAETFQNVDDMRCVNNLADKFIVGSDQVFMKYMYEPMGAYTTLDWVLDSKEKYGFACSFGYKEFVGDDKLRAKMGYFLKKFDAISTREYDGVNILKDNFDIDGICTLDPVFLLDDNEYNKLADKSTVQTPENYLFAYILDKSEEKHQIISKIANLNNLEVKFAYNPFPELQKDSLEIYTEDWLKYYRDAKFVVTDSFHGLCMALKFKKQFLFFMNEFRGASRFETLVKDFDIGNRIISSIDEVEEKLKSVIDYSILDIKMQKRLDESMDFLKSILSVKKNKTLSDYDIMIEQCNKQKNELNHFKECVKYSNRKHFYRLKYFSYKLLKNFCFGSTKHKIGQKKNKYKDIVNMIDTL